MTAVERLADGPGQLLIVWAENGPPLRSRAMTSAPAGPEEAISGAASTW